MIVIGFVELPTMTTVTESVIYQDGTKEEYTYYENNWLKSLVNKRADGSIMDTMVIPTMQQEIS